MKWFVFAFIVCIGAFPLNAQSDYTSQTDSCVSRLSNFVRNINTFNYLNPQEKVYLHFDNTCYFVGDTIWFKAYVVTATDLKPTIHSRVLYVELLSPEGHIVETKILKIENGTCHGELALKSDTRSGFYEVRSYTRVMLNYGKETLFSRFLPVYKEPEYEGDYHLRSMHENYKNIENIRDKSVENFDKVNMTFFPEGGNLVKGLNSQIAFKSTNDKGQAIDINGTIINHKNEEIATFSTIHQGMGIFRFCPDSTNYKVNFTYKNENYTYRLPEPLPSGYVMTINNLQKESTIIQIERSDNNPGDTIGINISNRGQVYVFNILNMTNQKECQLKISKSVLPTGVNQITIFTKNGDIIAQRMIFINHEDKAIIQTSTSHKAYKPFEKISLDFLLKDQNKNPVETSFSLSIRDSATAFSGQPFGNIRTNMLLASDLKGYIENADYYLETDDNIHRQSLDLLMMIQGWSRYNWQQMAGKEVFENRNKIENGIVIDGTIYGFSIFGKTPKPNVDVNMWLYTEKGNSQKGVCTTDKEGRFNFLPADPYGRWNLLLETSKSKNAERKQQKVWTRIQLDRVFSPTPRSYPLIEATLPENISNQENTATNAISPQKNSITGNQILKEVRVSTKKKSYAASNDIVYDVEKEIDELIDQGKNLPFTVFDYLTAKDRLFWFEGVNGSRGAGTFRYGSGGWATVSFDAWGKWIGGWGHEEETYDRRIEEVKKIVVSKDQYKNLPNNYECTFLDGVVVFVYPFKNASARVQKGMRVTYLEGFSILSKEFFNPDYSKGVLPGDVDFRRTLYWNPDVKTDSTGKAIINFYNNSTCKKITISAEGITKDGKTIAL